MAKVKYQDHNIYEMRIKQGNDDDASIHVDYTKDISIAPSDANLDSLDTMIILTSDVKMINANEQLITFKDLKKGDILKSEFIPHYYVDLIPFSNWFR